MRLLLLLLPVLLAGPLPVWAGPGADVPAACGQGKDAHRLRELRLRQAFKNGDLSREEAERLYRELHRHEKRQRLAPQDGASAESFDLDAQPRRYWRDQRREQGKSRQE